MAKTGFLIWITGLAGSGKTTLGQSVRRRLLSSGVPTVLLDGDALRAMTGGVFGYGIEDRRRCAEFYSRLCKLMTEQNLNVICCTISMFDSVRALNRTSVVNYLEVYLNADPELLKARDQKSLYSRETASEVMGRDLAVEVPKNPDLTFELGQKGLDAELMAEQVLAAVAQRGWRRADDQVQY